MKLQRSLFALLIFLASASLAEQSFAEPTADEKRRAAGAFDEGVAKFKAADYPAAARAFLAADAVLPNAQAIRNAIAAARRANDFILVAEAADRVLGRPSDATISAEAREALSDASTRLALVELSCDVDPCTLALDGARVPAGRVRIVPGTHDFVATMKDGAHADEHVNAVAGATYRLAMHPKTATSSVVATPSSSIESPAATSGLPGTTAPSPVASSGGSVATPDASSRGGKLSPAVFYAGAGVSIVLLGLTTWSGIDTIGEKNKYYDHDPSYNQDTVYRKAHRTDAFLGATVIVGAATALVGWRLVDWSGGKASASARVDVSMTPQGAMLVARGAF
jgi:hypothetical protein